jgi:hypothetical protein
LTDYVPGAAKPFLEASGVIIGIISAANSVKKEKLDLQANPKSYLLNLRSELSGDDILQKIKILSWEFGNGSILSALQKNPKLTEKLKEELF